MFIDISSAFDKLDPQKAIAALEKRGFENHMTEWYKDYLTNRYSKITIKGINTIRHINTGCPQGGVLSTILWCVAFYNLLELFHEGDITSHGALIITGDRQPRQNV